MSEQHGPYVQDGELWTCYEHSPTGALLAVAYVYAAMGNAEGFADTWIPESKLHAESKQFEEKGGVRSIETEGTLTPAGYRYISYTPETAVIDYVNEYQDTEGEALLVMRFTLTWEQDRWMIDPDAQIDQEPRPIDDMDGYVRWGPAGGPRS